MLRFGAGRSANVVVLSGAANLDGQHSTDTFFGLGCNIGLLVGYETVVVGSVLSLGDVFEMFGL